MNTDTRTHCDSIAEEMNDSISQVIRAQQPQ